MSVKPLEIKEQVYFKEYKNIIRSCLEDGVILPSLLEMIDVPVKYDFKESEIEKLSVSDESMSKRQQAFLEREEKYGAIETDDIKELNDAYNELDNIELMAFIGKYPVYQKLLK